jgi:cell division protein FtsQ
MAAAPAFNAAAGSPVPGELRLMQATASVLLAVAALAFVVLAVNWAIHRPIFALRAIRIEGEVTRSNAATIRANATPKLAGNFFTIDLAKARRAFESVPWVRQAVVRRVWPNRLAVQLEEHRAVAVWGRDSATDKLVDSFGEVFEANLGDIEDDNLPVLSGPEGSATQMLTMLHRLQPVFERLDMHVDGLALSARGSWHADLDSGADIELGRGSEDDVVARAERFVASLTQVTSRYQRPLEHADLRHADGYAVRLKGITTVVPTAKDKK